VEKFPSFFRGCDPDCDKRLNDVSYCRCCFDVATITKL